MYFPHSRKCEAPQETKWFLRLVRWLVQDHKAHHWLSNIEKFLWPQSRPWYTVAINLGIQLPVKYDGSSLISLWPYLNLSCSKVWSLGWKLGTGGLFGGNIQGNGSEGVGQGKPGRRIIQVAADDEGSVLGFMRKRTEHCWKYPPQWDAWAVTLQHTFPLSGGRPWWG